MEVTAYLAGPDVFLPEARAHALRRMEICARHGIVGRPPLNEDVESLRAMSDEHAWRTIFRKDVAMMEGCDIIIANLTPFRGPSADAGTLVELGWFLGRGRPIFGYSNSAKLFSERSSLHTEAIRDSMPGLSVAGFGLPDNLMIAGAVLESGGYPIVLPPNDQSYPFDALDVFELCVEIAAWKMGLRQTPTWLPT